LVLSDTDSPDYLIIGHVTKDKGPQGALLGGTCSYAGLTALRMGLRTAAVTSFGPDIPSPAMLTGIHVENVPSNATLTYEHIPSIWRRTPIVHLAPIAQEMSPAMCGRFRGSLVCVTMQGWLRGQDANANVMCQPHPELAAHLPEIDVMVFSRADLFHHRHALVPLMTSAGLAIETLGPEGCKIYHSGRVTHVPVKPEVEVDPTGAGDIFAAAFFVRYWESNDVVEAARFANACAALSVRKAGLACIPLRSAVEAHQVKLYGG
jgi:hypothetical protein